jgi:hypothetical protein
MPRILVQLVNAGSATGHKKVGVDVEDVDTVEALRSKIETSVAPLVAHEPRISAAPAFQAIYRGETLLLDGNSLRQYNLEKDSELQVVLRQRPQVLRLDVGGLCHSAGLDSLMAVEGSRLRSMFEPVAQGGSPLEGGVDGVAEGVPLERAPPLPQGPDGAFLIDRDGTSFRHILNFLRARRKIWRDGVVVGAGDAAIVLPDSKVELQQLVAEARYYRLAELEDCAQAELERMAEQERGPFFASTSTRLFETAVPCGPRQGRSNLPLHLVTWIRLGEHGSHLMWHLRFQGFDFQSSAPYDIVAVGYQNGQHGLQHDGVSYSTSPVPNSVRLEQYSTGDGFLAFKLTSQGDWHASSLVVDFVGAPNEYLQRGLAALRPEGGTFQWLGHAPAEAKLVVAGAGMDAVNGYYKEGGIVDHGRPRYRKVDGISYFSWQKLQPARPNDWRLTLRNSVYISFGDADKPPTDGWQETGHMPDQVTAPVPRIVWL